MGITIFILASMLAVTAGAIVFVYLQYRTAVNRNQNLQHQIEQAAQTLQNLQEKLKILTEHRDVTEQARREFLANMIHELRSYLNVMLGHTQIFHREDRLTRKQRKAIDVIHRYSEHLLMLFSEITDFSELESREVRLAPTNFNLRRFLIAVADIIRTQAEQRRLTVVTDFSAELPKRICGDERRLRQVLLTLLGNAIKFTNEGSVTFRVTIGGVISSLMAGEQEHDSSKPPTHCLRFEVEDTGIGIPSDQLSEIFQPFHVIRNNAQYKKGTRLGLAISQQLVQLMGGELRVTSQPRRGSMFWFEITLPEATDDEPAPVDVPTHHVVGFTGPLRKILIADDQYENRVVLKEMLLPLGFSIIEALDGFEVLTKAAQHQPDLILIDLTMPVLSGFESIRHIRQMPAISEVKVVGMSASVLRQIQQESFRAGGDDFLVKPIQLDTLLDCLQRHLNIEWLYAEVLREQVEEIEE
jgi:signal transduction histidine kinase/ActR/RegA family two-component response regulator